MRCIDACDATIYIPFQVSRHHFSPSPESVSRDSPACTTGSSPTSGGCLGELGSSFRSKSSFHHPCPTFACLWNKSFSTKHSHFLTMLFWDSSILDDFCQFSMWLYILYTTGRLESWRHIVQSPQLSLLPSITIEFYLCFNTPLVKPGFLCDMQAYVLESSN